VGLETAAALGLVGSQVFGAIGQDRSNARNLRAQQARQAQIQGMVQPYLTPAGQANPYSSMITDYLKNGVRGTTPTPVGTEAFNPGQDSLLQMMRSSPDYQANASLDSALQGILGGKPFDTTDQFSTLGALSDQDVQRQVAGLHASAGSLGQRFGTASGNAEGLLRSTAATNLAAQRAQIAQNAFNVNQQNILGAAGLAGGREGAMNNFVLQALQQRIGAAQAAGQLGLQGRQLSSQEQQFNSGQQQQNNQFLNSFMLQALAQAGGLQQGANSQNAQLLAILAGQPVPQGQPSAIPGAAGDISQMALLWPFLQGILKGGAGSTASATPAFMPNVQPWSPPPFSPGFNPTLRPSPMTATLFQ
jgi:hypothetical protein